MLVVGGSLMNDNSRQQFLTLEEGVLLDGCSGTSIGGSAWLRRGMRHSCLRPSWISVQKLHPNTTTNQTTELRLSNKLFRQARMPAHRTGHVQF